MLSICRVPAGAAVLPNYRRIFDSRKFGTMGELHDVV
jgi:hypothetical protein